MSTQMKLAGVRRYHTSDISRLLLSVLSLIIINRISQFKRRKPWLNLCLTQYRDVILTLSYYPSLYYFRWDCGVWVIPVTTWFVYFPIHKTFYVRKQWALTKHWRQFAERFVTCLDYPVVYKDVCCRTFVVLTYVFDNSNFNWNNFILEIWYISAGVGWEVSQKRWWNQIILIRIPKDVKTVVLLIVSKVETNQYIGVGRQKVAFDFWKLFHLTGLKVSVGVLLSEGN